MGLGERGWERCGDELPSRRERLGDHAYVLWILGQELSPASAARWWNDARPSLGGRSCAQTWMDDPECVVALAELLLPERA